MNREKISILVPSYNEERHIRPCLEGLLWGDELVVVDSFSTDMTPAIAREYAHRVIQHEYINSAAQKNWALPQLTYDWVLIVDCDERITPELRDEIQAILENPDRLDGYYIYRKNHFIDQPVNYCGWQTDRCLRLFRKSLGKYEDKEVHAEVILNGNVGHLKKRMLHYTFDSFEQYMKKFDRYTSLAAVDRSRRTQTVRWYHLTLRPAFRFFKQYILKRGFLDGKTGLIICILAAFSVFLKYAKLWELHKRKKTPAQTPPTKK
ncbi:glycosyltransferase family 2 protein [bacterium]|nr:glycosyltransferase family 2 protein [candidate division CSSED10-310 bacterium]